MNTLACSIDDVTFLRSGDNPLYRQAACRPPATRHLAYQVIVEETGEVVFDWKPERPRNSSRNNPRSTCESTAD